MNAIPPLRVRGPDDQFWATGFRDQYAKTKTEGLTTLRKLIEPIQTRTAAEKERLPLDQARPHGRRPQRGRLLAE